MNRTPDATLDLLRAAPGEPVPPDPWRRLLEEARRGAPEALGLLLDACRPHLPLLARQQLDADLRGKVDPSDIVAETFLKALRDFGAFQGQTAAEFEAWLRRILANNVANITRKYRTGGRQVDREVSIEGSPIEELENALASTDQSPSSQAGVRERDEDLEKALGQLPEHYRRVIELRQAENLSWEEVGTQLDRSGEAARQLWTRAVERLGELLGPDDEPR